MFNSQIFPFHWPFLLYPRASVLHFGLSVLKTNLIISSVPYEHNISSNCDRFINEPLIDNSSILPFFIRLCANNNKLWNTVDFPRPLTPAKYLDYSI